MFLIIPPISHIAIDRDLMQHSFLFSSYSSHAISHGLQVKGQVVCLGFLTMVAIIITIA